MKSDIVKLQRAEARARKVWERASKKLGKAKLVEKKARKAYDEAKGLRQSIEASLGDALKKLGLADEAPVNARQQEPELPVSDERRRPLRRKAV